jgi:hypothetical protein
MDELLNPEADEDATEYQALYSVYLTQLIEAGNDEAAAMPLADRLARKRLQGEILTEAEDLALLGITAAIDFE